MEKYGTVGQATDDNIIQHRKAAICMQHNEGVNAHTHS